MKCGYDLTGLTGQGRCPECGTPTQAALRTNSRFADNMVDSELWYMRTVAVGFTLMGLALLLLAAWFVYTSYRTTTLVPLSPVLAWGLLFLPGMIWLLGVSLTTWRRPILAETVRDPILDRAQFRWSARLSQLMPLATTGVAMGSSAAYLAAGPGGSALGGWLAALAGLLALGCLFGLVPLSVYLSSLADWAGDSGAGNRLRGSAWLLLVCGSVSSLCHVVLSVLPDLPFAFLIVMGRTLTSLLVFLGVVLMLASVFQLWIASMWAIQNALAGRARALRVADRRQEALEAQRRRDEEAAALNLAEPTDAPAATAEALAAGDDEAIPLIDELDGPQAPASASAQQANPVGNVRHRPRSFHEDPRQDGAPNRMRESHVVERSGDDLSPYDLAPEDDRRFAEG